MERFSYILQLKDQFSKGMDRAFDSLKNFDGQWDGVEKKVGDGFDGIGQRAKRFRTKFAGEIGGAFSGIMDAVPGGGQLGAALVNPYVAAGAAVGLALGAIRSQVNQASQEFQANQQVVKTYFQGTQAEIDTLTAKTGALSKVFQVDAGQLGQAAKTLSADFGESAESAFDLVKQGLQATRGALDIDQLKEYSTQMKDAGLSAQQTVALAVRAQQAGIYQDKALDAIKEANLRLREMPTATRDALVGMEEAGARFQIDGALFDADSLQASLKKGEISTVQAAQAISKELDKIDPQSRQRAIADIFGGPGEDAGARFFELLAEGNLSMQGLVDKSDAFIQRQDRRLQLEEQLNGKVAEFAPMVNEIREEFNLLMLRAKVALFDVVGQGLSWFRENSESLLPIWEGIKTVMGFTKNITMGLASILGDTVGLIGDIINGNWDGAFDRVKNIGRTAVQDVMGLGGGQDDPAPQSPFGNLPLPAVTGGTNLLSLGGNGGNQTTSTITSPGGNLDNRSNDLSGVVSGPGRGAGKNLTVNVTFGDTIFRVSNMDGGMQSIEELAQRFRQVLLREVANFEATA